MYIAGGSLLLVAGAADGSLYAAAQDGEVARVSHSTDGGATWER